MQSDLDVIRGMNSAFARGGVANVPAALAPTNSLDRIRGIS
jgi:hypothetical protein